LIRLVIKNEMETTVSEQFLNQKQLARRWGLSPRTIERWRRQRRGPSYLKLVGRVVYRHEDIVAFEAAQFHAGGAAPSLTRTMKTLLLTPAPGTRHLATAHYHVA
jgi:predicted DNA-binding transcriptional regulator AlpA